MSKMKYNVRGIPSAPTGVWDGEKIVSEAGWEAERRLEMSALIHLPGQERTTYASPEEHLFRMHHKMLTDAQYRVQCEREREVESLAGLPHADPEDDPGYDALMREILG